MIEAFFRNIESGKILFQRFQTVCCLSARRDSGVFLVRDIENNNKEVALKIVSSDLSCDPDFLNRFRNELNVSNKILHPNVLHGEEFFEDESFAAFTMDYSEGGTLADLLQRREPVSLEQVLDIAQQLCEALQAIHDAGILHRDLKPENILLSEDNKVRISDFGIALMGSSVKTSKDSALFGTVNYLSPEYIKDGRFDQQSDIYALGLILFELLTGRLPFHETAPLRVLMERVQHNPDPPRAFAPRIPDALNDIVLKAIARNPKRRYRSANEMLSDLLTYTKQSKKARTQVGTNEKVSLTESVLDDSLLTEHVQ